MTQVAMHEKTLF